MFGKYPFDHDEESVGILGSEFEGIYLWFTLNNELGSFFKGSASGVATLDLGDDSAQVTFVPTEQVENEFLLILNC